MGFIRKGIPGPAMQIAESRDILHETRRIIKTTKSIDEAVDAISMLPRQFKRLTMAAQQRHALIVEVLGRIQMEGKSERKRLRSRLMRALRDGDPQRLDIFNTQDLGGGEEGRLVPATV